MADMNDTTEFDFDDRVTELEVVDPAKTDGLYWARFQREVMQRALSELARRREQVRLTVSEALSGWARLVLPSAVAAAAVAGFLIVQTPESGDEVMIVEDILDVPSELEEESTEVDFTPTLSATAVAENF